MSCLITERTLAGEASHNSGGTILIDVPPRWHIISLVGTERTTRAHEISQEQINQETALSRLENGKFAVIYLE